MKPLDKLFWMRTAAGVLTGSVLGLLTVFAGLSGPNGVMLAMLVYIITHYLARFTLSAQIPPKEARKLVTTGLGSFIMLVLFFWILVNTIIGTALK